jgi:hypothetical protein
MYTSKFSIDQFIVATSVSPIPLGFVPKLLMVPKVVFSSSDKNQHGLVHVHVPILVSLFSCIHRNTNYVQLTQRDC